jgi:hypothetical protein
VSRNKRKTAERLNAAFSAENSRLIAEHGSAGIGLNRPEHGLVPGRHDEETALSHS